jgi:hypothetical protein
MAELFLDSIRDASVELGTLNRRIVRTATVTGITATNKFSYLLNALKVPGMPQLKDRHPEIPDLFLQRRFARGMAGDVAEIELEYLPNFVTAIVANTVIFRDNTSIQTEMAESALVNGTLVPFSSTGGPRFNGRMFKINPFRQLDVTAFLTSRPAAIIKKAVGTVNRGKWMGDPQGYWLCVKCQESRSSTQPGVVVLELSFMSRVYRNWMEWDFSRNANGSVTYTPDATDIAAVTNNYTAGVRTRTFQPSGGTTSAIILAGQYNVANFKQLFGFDNDTVLRIRPLGSSNTIGQNFPTQQQ